MNERKKLEDNLSPEIKRIVQLEKQNQLLNAKLREAQDGILDSQALVDFIHGTTDVKYDGRPNWLVKANPKTSKVTGIPVLFLSDIHFDERVNAAQIEFNNIEELDATVAVIEAQYQKVVAKDNLNDDSAEALADIRAISQQFFEEQRLNVDRITTVNTPTIPMAVLAYQYYGDTDNTDALITLNGTKNVSQVTGDTRILTA